MLNRFKLGRERWAWLALFCLLSLVLHLGIGVASRNFYSGIPAAVPSPEGSSFEVSLGSTGPTVTPREPIDRPKIAHQARVRITPRNRLRADTGRVAVAKRPIAPALPTNARTPDPARVVPKAEESPLRAAQAPVVSREVAPGRLTPVPFGTLTGIRDAGSPVVVTSAPRAVGALSPRLHPMLPPSPMTAVPVAAIPALPPTVVGGEPIAVADPAPPGGAAPARATELPDGVGAGNRSGLTRGIPFGKQTGLVTGASDGNGALGTLGIEGGGRTGKPFRLHLTRESSTNSDGGPPVHVVYVLDVSGSMVEEGKIERAREALHQAVSELHGDDTLTFVTFADRAVAYSNGLKPATNFYISTMETNFDLVQPSGQTNLSGALDLALGMPGVSYVFVLSDGEPTVGITDFDELSEHVRNVNAHGVRITTFALGAGEPVEGSAFLRRLAKENGGDYRYVDVRAR